MITSLFILLALFQLKHFLADYPLQTRYMLGKFAVKRWILPLLSHAAVHGGMTALIVGVWTGSMWLAAALGVFDLVIHFTMDRIKASPALLGRWKHSEPAFWYTLGLDQMVHHLTHYAIIWGLL